MSLEAMFDKSGSAGTLANEAGWAAFTHWVQEHPVEEFPLLDHLVTYGYVDDLDELQGECESLMAKDPPEGVEEILHTLAIMLDERDDADEEISVGSGVEGEE